MPRIKGQFPTYKQFAESDLNKILTEEERNLSLKVSANFMQSAILINMGAGKFSIKALPYQAQWSPVYGILADDYDQDGNIDLLLCTNDLGTEVNTGQYDALNGLYLKGTGDGNFKPIDIRTSGFFIPSNGKAIVKFMHGNNYSIAVSQNRAPLELFKANEVGNMIRLTPTETSVIYKLKNGSSRREEFYFGNTFLSQGSRFIALDNAISSITIFSNNGQSREIKHN
jgi:hypothetical protein